MYEIDKITTQMKKGVLEFLVLSIISRGNVYASDIISLLKESDLLVVEGTLYPLLSRLKTEKLLEYVWVESPQGPPRKYYTLTQKGKNTLVTMQRVWDQLSSTVDIITK